VRFPSNLISIFNFHGGTQTPDDGLLAVPPVVQPTVEIPTPLLTAQTGTIGDDTLRRASFAQNNGIYITNAAAQDDYLFILAPGLWDLLMIVSSLSNHTTFTKVSYLYLGVEGTPGAAFITAMSAIANVPQTATLRFKLAVGNQQGVSLLAQVPVQGVGESTRFDVGTIANRLG